MECCTGWDTCFCVSMGTNKTDEYSIGVRCLDNELLVEVKMMNSILILKMLQMMISRLNSLKKSN